MTIGERIKYFRTNSGLTQKKLSELTGIHEVTIRQYEAGKYIPKYDKLIRLAKIFDVDVEEIIGGDHITVSMEKEKQREVRKKILPKYFKAVQARDKNFELRVDEDNIQVGDLLILEEWNGYYTGNRMRRYVKYVLRDVPALGLMPGYCIIGW